ncbi:hypothetical protein CMO86_03680 [Candidatus Woesearchaeota archaeon]|nr:hypothetical protein [Candidatus Woesearchaeota archaeon]
MRDTANYKFGGFPLSAVNVLRLISELEGSYQLLKYLGFKEDMDTLDEIKQKYYKLYFKLKKQEKLPPP